jgi:hypothetical protein
MPSFKSEFLVEGAWYDNAVRFATHAEAHDATESKFMSWTVPTDRRVVESDDEPNYIRVGDLKRGGTTHGLPDGFRRVTWGQVTHGTVVHLFGMKDGKPHAYGPHIVRSVANRMLESGADRTHFTHLPEELLEMIV